MVAATGTIHLNLGCGNVRLRDGYLNLDADPLVNPDICARVPPIPLPDQSCARVYTSHFLEHLSDDEVMTTLAEIRRVLVPGGVLEVVVPYALSHAAFQDPTHKSYWVPEKALYFTPHFAYLHPTWETRFQLVQWLLEPEHQQVQFALVRAEDGDPCRCPQCQQEGKAE